MHIKHYMVSGEGFQNKIQGPEVAEKIPYCRKLASLEDLRAIHEHHGER